MSETTKIEWCDASLSPWWGCTKVSPGCANCYAEGIDARFNGGAHWGKGMPRKRIAGGEKSALALNRKAMRMGKRLKVFPSMCDPFDPEVPIEWFFHFLHVMRRTPWLDWPVLTKRPELWRERIGASAVKIESADDLLPEDIFLHRWLVGWMHGTPPANVWIGTSVEDQKRADERIPELLKIPAVVRFLSAEPLLGPVDLLRVSFPTGATENVLCNEAVTAFGHKLPLSLDWVIVGGESGPKARPMHPGWARSLRDQCVAAGVPFFFKQWGEWFPHGSPAGNPPMGKVGKKAAGRLLDGREWNEFPKGGEG